MCKRISVFTGAKTHIAHNINRESDAIKNYMRNKNTFVCKELRVETVFYSRKKKLLYCGNVVATIWTNCWATFLTGRPGNKSFKYLSGLLK